MNGEFFKAQLENFVSLLQTIKDYVDNKGEKITFDEVINFNVLAVNLIPPSKEDPNKPDPDWLKANELIAYAKFWVAKDYQNEAGVMVAEEIKDFIYKYEIPNLINPYQQNKNKKFEFGELIKKQVGGYIEFLKEKVA